MTVDTKKKKTRQTFTDEASENDRPKVAKSLAASVELNMVPAGLFAPAPSSPPRKLLDGPKKRKKKKKTQPDAAVLAVKKDLSSFLEGLHSRK